MNTTFRPVPKPVRIKKEKISRPRRVAMESNPLEEIEHKTVVEWLQWHKVDGVHHSPNGGYRHKTTAALMKELGTSPGFPDLFIVNPPPAYNGEFVGVAIEMKRRKESHTTKEQLEWLQRLNRARFLTRVCKGSDEAIDFLETCGYGHGTNRV